MKSFGCLCMLLLLGALGTLTAQQIPARMTYCGINLELAPALQKKLAVEVKRIHESPRYFRKMVLRANQYMPFIEEGLAYAGAPEDLKFLAIQESGLRPAVVSSSNAVGFWQFKVDAAREMGLQVDNQIDERRHIFRASVAAGHYLGKANYDFDNWLYAVMAYYEGPTGAVKHTNPTYYGAKRMRVGASLHWYVIKALAHKLAYAPEVNKRQRPEMSWTPHSSSGEYQVKKLASRHGLNLEQFLEHNPWILDQKRLPRDMNFTYYTPLPGAQYAGHLPDPNKVSPDQTEPEPTEVLVQTPPPAKPEVEDAPHSIEEAAVVVAAAPAPVEKPASNPPYKSPQLQAGQTAAETPSKLSESSFVEFQLKRDLHYGIQYVSVDGTQSLAEIADNHGKSLTDLLAWNGLLPGQELQMGSMIYLQKARKCEYHIVLPGESLETIAMRHFTSVKKIKKRNRIPKFENRIYEGQKLYLRKMKPVKERMIVLQLNKASEVAQVEPEGMEPVKTPTSRADTGMKAPNPKEVMPASPKANPEILPQTPIKEREVATSPDPATDEVPGPSVDSEPQTQPTSISQLKPQLPYNSVEHQWITHIVAAGETLWQISKRYDTKVEIIKMVNKLESDNIAKGQSLRILAKAHTLGAK